MDGFSLILLLVLHPGLSLTSVDVFWWDNSSMCVVEHSRGNVPACDNSDKSRKQVANGIRPTLTEISADNEKDKLFVTALLAVRQPLLTVHQEEDTLRACHSSSIN